MPRGGKRAGAGAKPMDPEKRRKMVAMRLAPEVRAYLGQCATGTATATVEAAITRSAGFKRWKGTQ